MQKPLFLDEDHVLWLDSNFTPGDEDILRDFEAQFPELTTAWCKRILEYWKKTYSQRNGV